MKLFFSQLGFKEYRKRRETLFQLRKLSERMLQDCGYSVELLEEGIKAWPWREIPEEPNRFQFMHPTNENSFKPLDTQLDTQGEKWHVDQQMTPQNKTAA